MQAPAGATSQSQHRVQILGIDERSPGVDPVLAGIFKTMRASLGMPPEDLARLLHTRPEVLANLEAGRVRSLPPLPELVRLMKEYGALLNIETDPIIVRIREQTADKSPPLQAVAAVPGTRRIEPGHITTGRIGAMFKSAGANWSPRRQGDGDDAETVATAALPVARQTTPRAALLAPTMAPRGSGEKKPDRSSRKTKRWRRLGTAAISVAFVAGAAWTAQSQPPVLYAAVDQLPPSVAKSLRRGIDMIAVSMSSTTTRDGLTWIETSDPRRRKSDRLPVKTGVETPGQNR